MEIFIHTIKIGEIIIIWLLQFLTYKTVFNENKGSYLKISNCCVKKTLVFNNLISLQDQK